ncbi:sulfite exporter TauE/SafE family protein [Aliikangiella coralliicola]|uniref:Sulfite exporter TauE/SafE family protein n=1 Tax=Aliikangiella coralliicola TaxID=2592383 RepID=A0A545UDJ8_9GAMM|nr:sulfite exporter TauE/SafE family protein [Aliikangiella coralliicola]TQV87528.1 sulfite exporter TauE/SafE family protein [Aliikangiella coralliicola]
MAEISLVSAFVLGLLGAGHCIGMCGGIISSLSLATADQSNKWIRITFYQVGRILSYCLIGLLAGWFGAQVNQLSPLPILSTLSGILLILMGFYVSRIWMALSYLERLGKLLWNKISPLSQSLFPVKTTSQALLLGALWGWLPCGLVYTSLSYAITTANPLHSSLFMLCFGLGTLPATLLAGAASATLKNRLNRPPVRLISALLFVGFGIYILYGVFAAGEMNHHHHH